MRPILVASLAFLLAGCSGGGGPTDPPGGGNPQPNPAPPTTPAPGANERIVQVQASSFSPANLTVPPGTTVIWVNAGGAGHTVTPQGHNAWQRVETTATAGEVLRVTFGNAGTYNYICEPHAATGMVGSVVVQ
jgi:plastocyanin